MKIPITQSKQWQILQDDLGEKSFYEQGTDYQYLAIVKNTPLGNYLYLPYGPVSDTEDGFNDAITSLKKLATSSNSFFIRIEPQSSALPLNTSKSLIKSTDLNPKETWILDLGGEELKEKLPSRLLRYYRNSEKNGIKIETSHNPEDIKYLLNLQKALAKKKGINTFSELYLKTELKQPFATLYLAKKENESNHLEEVIATGLVFDDETTRYNLQGAQSEEGRREHATGILTIKLILDAKEKGLKHFDFWGIAPENAPKDHPWAGFTAFKKTFAGREVDYAGTHDIILKPFKYRLYQLTRKLNRLLRK